MKETRMTRFMHPQHAYPVGGVRAKVGYATADGFADCPN